MWDTFDDLLEDTAYGYQRHKVTTEDGYILTMVRLVKKHETEEERGNRTPVIF